MSRVGKNPIIIPQSITVTVQGNTISIVNKEKKVEYTVSPFLKIILEDNKITLSLIETNAQARTMWGTDRSVLNNMIKGMTEGFTKTLDINGVGYRVAVENIANGSQLVLQLGYSHEIKYPLPVAIKAVCPKPTQIILSGSCKQMVGQVASEIRAFRPPEPYKGKGIKYENEKILRKEGKKK